MIFAQKGSLLLSSLDVLVETYLSRVEKPLRKKPEMLSTYGIISPWNRWCWSYMQAETVRMRNPSDEWPHESALLSFFLIPWALHGWRYNSTAPCLLHGHTYKHCLSRNEQQFSMTMQPNLFRTSFEESLSPCPSHLGKIVMIWFFFGKLWRVGREWEISLGSSFCPIFFMYWRCISEDAEAVWECRNGPKLRNYWHGSYVFWFILIWVFFSHTSSSEIWIQVS